MSVWPEHEQRDAYYRAAMAGLLARPSSSLKTIDDLCKEANIIADRMMANAQYPAPKISEGLG